MKIMYYELIKMLIEYERNKQPEVRNTKSSSAKPVYAVQPVYPRSLPLTQVQGKELGEHSFVAHHGVGKYMAPENKIKSSKRE